MISSPERFRWFRGRDELDLLEAWRVMGALVAGSLVVGPWAAIDPGSAAATALAALTVAYAATTLVGAFARRRKPSRRWAVLTALLLVDGIAVTALISLGEDGLRRGLPLMLVEIAILAAMGPVRSALKAALWPMLCLAALAAALSPPPAFAASGASLAMLLGSFVAPIVVIVAARHVLRPLDAGIGAEVPRPRGRTRALVYGTVGAVAVILPVTTALAPPAPRATVAFVAMLLAPGMLLTSWMRVQDPLEELVLAVVGSLTIAILCTQGMLAIGWWHPKALSTATAVAGLALLRQAWRVRPLGGAAMPSRARGAAARAVEVEGAAA